MKTGQVTFQGNPLTLTGDKLLGVGDKFPENISLLNCEMKPVDITATTGSKIIITVPSLDTPVCDTEARTFNSKASKKNLKVFAVSADLPFALGRWCAATGVENVTTLSDHAQMSLANSLGIHIMELRLFARAVYIVNERNEIVYRQIVNEVTYEPDYDAAMSAAEKEL